MNKLGLFALAAQAAPKLFQVRRRTWIGIGVGLLVLLGLLIWAAIALMGWFFGQAQGWSAMVPDAARGALKQVEQQVEQVAPGAREKLGAHLGHLVPAIKPEDRPQRDVSGTDLAPVARYPGLARNAWFREGRLATVKYEGLAAYAAVLDHYAQGFAALGFTQQVQSAAPEAETHAYVKGAQRYLVKIASKPKGLVAVDIETHLE